MKKIKSFLSLLLAFSLVFGLAAPVGAAAEPEEPELIVTPSVESINVGTGTADVVYTISIDPNGNKVGAIQFSLSAPEGMTLATNKLPNGYSNQGGAGYWIAAKDLKLAEDEDTGEKTGIFETFEYTVASGYFAASGTTAERRLTTEAVLMTIQATVDISEIKTYTLGVENVVIGEDGDTDLNGTATVTDVNIVKAPELIAGPIAISAPVVEVGATIDVDDFNVPAGNFTQTAESLGGGDSATVAAGGSYVYTVTLKPADGYYFDDTTTATVGGEKATVTLNDDGTITISYTYSFAASAAASVAIYDSTGTNEIKDTQEIVLPGNGEDPNTASFTAKVLDQYNQPMTDVTWSINSSSDKVTVDANGVVTVKAGASAGLYTLTATNGTASDSIEINVKKVPVATSVVVTGTKAITIPEDGSITVDGYSAVVYDQYGDPIDTVDFDWSIVDASGNSSNYVTITKNNDGSISINVTKGATAGKYTLTAEFSGVTGTLEITLTKKATTSIDVTEPDEITYDGQPVTAGDEGSDFVVSVTGSTEEPDITWYKVDEDGKLIKLTSAPEDAGNYCLVIKVEGDDTHASAEKTINFTIAPKELTVTATATDRVYDGTTDVEVIGTLTGAVTGDDVEIDTITGTVEYKNVGTDKTVTVEVTLKGEDAGNYTVKAVTGVTVDITAKEITAPAADTTEFVYTGSKLTYGISSTADYTVTGNEQTDADTYTVTVALTDKTNTVWKDAEEGKETADLTYTFTIKPADITATVSIEDWTYGDTAKAPSTEVKFGNAIITTGYGAVTYQYKAKNADDSTYTTTVPTAAGDYVVKATVAAAGNYNGTTATAEFTIAEKSLAGATIADIAPYDYNGEERKPTPEVTLDDKTLTAGVDFEYSYSNNINAGTATVTITGKGNYTGTANKTFTINPVDQTIHGNGFSIKIENTADLSVLFSAQGTLSFAIKEGTDTTGSSISGSTLTAGATPGSFTLVITAAAVAPNYNETTKEVTVTITAKDTQTVTVEDQDGETVEDELGLTYGDEDKSITATSKEITNADVSYKVVDENGNETDAVITIDENGNITVVGVGTVTIIVTVEGNDDYADAVIEITVTVAPKQITAPTAGTATYTYNGSEQTYEFATEGDKDWYTVTDNKKTDAGDYTVVVELTDKVNTVWADSKDIVNKTYGFEIQKATLTITADDQTIKVGDAMPELTYTVTGLKGETLESIGLEVTVSCDADTSKSGTYTIAVSGTPEILTNYTVTYVNGTLTVKNNTIIVTPVLPEKPDEEPDEDHSCPVCGGCTDAECTECDTKCLLLTMNFTDVEDGKWYTEGVEYVYHRSLMIGTSDTLFEIDGTTNRAMVVTILWRLAGKPAASGANPFTDVPAGQWYTDAVIWAASEGIVEGYGDGRFGPMDSITREQMAKILRGYAENQGIDVSESAELDKFVDTDEISSWAEEHVSWAVAEGLIQGVGNDRIDPQGYALRGQVATLIMRFCQNVLGAK